MFQCFKIIKYRKFQSIIDMKLIDTLDGFIQIQFCNTLSEQ